MSPCMPLEEAAKITDAVAVRVVKGAHVQFIDDRILVPKRIGGQPRRIKTSMLYRDYLRNFLINTDRNL